MAKSSKSEKRDLIDTRREKRFISGEHQLQVLDVQIVDVLAHLEGMLRHCHSIQRALLQLRAEAPPPGEAPPATVRAVLKEHGQEMQRECNSLAEVVADLARGVATLGPVAKEVEPPSAAHT
jgi:hypothetical protein